MLLNIDLLKALTQLIREFKIQKEEGWLKFWQSIKATFKKDLN